MPGRTVGLVPVPLELVLSGRDLTEPRLSPDGASVAFVHRWGAGTAISVVDAEGRGPERLVTFGPEPAPGRGLGGGCFTWMPNSTGIVYVARDGELWLVDGIELRRVTSHERACRAPAVDPDRGPFVVYVVDELEIWLTDLHTGRSRRLDDGRHEFCFDPVVLARRFDGVLAGMVSAGDAVGRVRADRPAVRSGWSVRRGADHLLAAR